METYQPTTRRPIADTLRKTATLSVKLAIKWDIHPNTISMCSIVAAAMAGVCYWQSGQWLWLLIPAAGFCYLRLWFNMLDGMVALGSGKASRLGEVFNEMPDRVSDIVIFAGVAHSGLCEPLLAYWVIILALLVAYVGTFGQAVGVGRQFGGVMSKPWRMVILHIGSWVAMGACWWTTYLDRVHDRPVPMFQLGWQWTNWLDLALVIILLGCVQTLWVRLWRIVGALKKVG